MDKVQLIIAQQIADIKSEKAMKIVLTYAIQESNNVDNSRDSTSKSIALPGTKRNRVIFGYADDVNVEDFMGQKHDYEAIVKEGGTTVMIGVVNLMKVQRDPDGVTFYITIVGNSREWVNTMKEASLQGIDMEGSHTLTKAVIDTAEVNNFNYTYGLINDGYMGGDVEIEKVEGWWDVDTWRCRYHLTNTNTIYGYKTNFAVDDVIRGVGFILSEYNVTQRVIAVDERYIDTDKAFTDTATGRLREVKGRVYITDRPLMWNAWKVLKTVFGEAGYQITSTFINSEFFNNIYLLFDSFKHTEEWCLDNYVKAGLSAPMSGSGAGAVALLFDTDIEDDSDNFNTTSHRFYAPSPMRVVFKISARVSQDGAVESTGYIRFNYGGADEPTNRPIKVVDITNDFTAIEGEGEYYMQTGDWISATLVITGVIDYNISVEETFFEAYVQQTVIKNTAISPGDFLPDIPQLDLIRALRHLFHWHFITDIHMKQVYIEPRDDFYLRSVIVDLSEKVDISKPIIYEEFGRDLSKELIFQYKQDDSDEGVKEWELLNDTTLASYTGDVLNKFAKDGEKAMENPLFAPTLMDAFPNIGLANASIPKIWGELDEGIDIPFKIAEYLPRILYFAGLQGVTGTDLWSFEGDDDRNTYPYFYSIKEQVGNENSLYFNSVGEVRGLFKKYWYNYLKTINESRKITANIRLTPSDIANFLIINSAKKDFRALYFLKIAGESVACRLEKINSYQLGGGLTTKCTFIRDVDRIYEVENVEVYENIFTNDLAIGNAHANGGISQYNVVWATVRSATEGRIVYGDESAKRGIGAHRVEHAPGQYYYVIQRGFFFFDTSAIPDGATLVEASLFMYKTGGDITQELAVYATGTPITAPLAVEDFDNFGSVLFGESNVVGLGYREIVLNPSGIANINKTGWTEFCLRDRYFDSNNVAPTYEYVPFKTYFSVAPVRKENYLRVRYTL